MPGVSPWYADRWGWGLTGAGAIATGVGLGLLISAPGLIDELNREPNQRERENLRDRAQTRRIAGATVGAVGIGLVVAGVVRLVLTDDAPSQSTEWQARTHVVFGRNWAGIQGSF